MTRNGHYLVSARPGANLITPRDSGSVMRVWRMPGILGQSRHSYRSYPVDGMPGVRNAKIHGFPLICHAQANDVTDFIWDPVIAQHWPNCALSPLNPPSSNGILVPTRGIFLSSRNCPIASGYQSRNADAFISSPDYLLSWAAASPASDRAARANR